MTRFAAVKRIAAAALGISALVAGIIVAPQSARAEDPAPVPVTNFVAIIDPQMMGQPTDYMSLGSAVCVTQWAAGAYESDFPVDPAKLSVKLPDREFLVLDFRVEKDWDLSYYYLYYVTQFFAEVRLSASNDPNNSVITDIVGNYINPPPTTWNYVIDYFSARIIVATSTSIPSSFTDPTTGKTVSTAGIPVLTVAPDVDTSLDLGVGMYAVRDFGESGGLMRSTTMTVSGIEFNDLGEPVSSVDNNNNVVGVVDVPPYVRLNEGWQGYSSCSAVPIGSHTQSLPTLSKAYEPALIQPEGTSRLTFTLLNAPDGSATGDWTFTDDLPSVQIGNSGQNMQLVVAEPDPLDLPQSTCNITSSSVVPGATKITISGNIPSGQPYCTVAVDVTTYIPPQVLADDGELFDPTHADFAFPIDLTNIVDTSTSTTDSPNTGLVGSAQATLRVEVPTVKVDISAPTLTTVGDGVSVSWVVSVLNATNLMPNGTFCGPAGSSPACPDQQVTAEDASVSPALGPSLSSPVWDNPPGDVDLTDPNNPKWLLPKLAPGQLIQATLTAQITDLGELDLFLPVQNGDQIVLVGGANSRGILQSAVTLNMDWKLPEDISPLANEALDNSILDANWNDWSIWAQAQAGAALWPSLIGNNGITRLASTAADSDRWDQMQTQLTPAVLDIKAEPLQDAILGSGPGQYQIVVTNTGSTLLTNVVLDDPAGVIDCGGSGGVIANLAPGDSATCTGNYSVSGDDISNRFQDQPIVLDSKGNQVLASEGVWRDYALGSPALHIKVAVSGTPEYLNPDGSTWLYPHSHLLQGIDPELEPPEFPLTVRNAATLTIPIYTVSAMPFTGGPKQFPFETLGLAVLGLTAAVTAGYLRRATAEMRQVSIQEASPAA